MSTLHIPKNKTSPQLKAECWAQILSLLSGDSFYFKSEQFAAFVELLNWHHILIDVLPHLSASPESHEFTSDQLDKLSEQGLIIRRKLLALSQTQNLIFNHFSESGIRHLFFKGIVLSHWLYENATARQCRDIDLIVHPEDHAFACSRLEKLGCVRIIPAPDLSDSDYLRYQSAMKDVSYLHTDSGTIIELHWALRPFAQAFQFDFDSAYESRRVMELGDTYLPILDDALHTRYLAAHGCLSHWGRLRWLLDWKLITDNTNLDWQAIIDSTSSSRELHYLKRAFAIANRQLNVNVPEPIQAISMPFANNYLLKQQCISQSQAKYPHWLNRQILNLMNQGDFHGICGYTGHMFKKLLAAKTLKPSYPEQRNHLDSETNNNKLE